VCGEAVTKRMRAYAGRGLPFSGICPFSADAACAEAFAVLVDEQHFAVEIAVVLCSFVPEFHIVLDDLQHG